MKNGRRNVLVGAICLFGFSVLGVQRAEAQVRVPGFLPSSNAFQFYNSWPSGPDWTITFGSFPVGPYTIPIGDAANGLCGGMNFVVRDYFESGVHIPLTNVNPLNGTPLFSYIANRLLDSLNQGNGALRFYELQWPITTDGGRQQTMLDEWPRIKAELDSGHLSPMGLIRVHSDFDPTKLGGNHQVLAYGYDLSPLDSRWITIHIYDSNYPDDDNVTLNLDFTGTPVGSQSTGESLYSFFRQDYLPRAPLPTQTWSNGFEGTQASAWWTAGAAGVELHGGAAHRGTSEGWANGASGWNAVNTWVSTVPGALCTVQAWIESNPGADPAGYVSVRSEYGAMPVLSELSISHNPTPGSYQLFEFNFTADGPWVLFYAGLWGTGADTWLRVDDVIVTCDRF